MGPRANFECRKCQATYEDLPVNSVRCPVCSFKRGFRRLFDAIQVSTTGHRVATVLDPMMKGQLTQMDQMRNDSQASERRHTENFEKHMELGTPEQREALIKNTARNGGPRWLGPEEAKSYSGLAAHPSIARDVKTHVWPHVRRRVIAADEITGIPSRVQIPETLKVARR